MFQKYVLARASVGDLYVSYNFSIFMPFMSVGVI